ncbi:MAG: WhiB family transcriptional regulator, redox-sensing transcriptional regulator [Actinomycetota bacterium]|nr:WhiB family transcriptional regulator, redox-sensing transcriptional regulator [Actinomycetota bacterium]
MIVGSLFAVLGVPVLPGARCRGRSHLFDEATQGEPATTVAARHRQAVGLCEHCPALAPCSEWYGSLTPSKRPAGVVAGRIPAQSPARGGGGR